ncbi:MAG: hypothetical protein L6R39_005502 [Caloplaca ligustica]|nr:MAG: hypothetical protein L6R39_005502 [Caloplaca ligustica]
MAPSTIYNVSYSTSTYLFKHRKGAGLYHWGRFFCFLVILRWFYGYDTSTMRLYKSTILAALAPSVFAFVASASVQSIAVDDAPLRMHSPTEVGSHQLEPRQAGIIAGALVISWAAGQMTGQYTRWRKELAAAKPGLNNAQGTACYKTGSRFPTAGMTSVITNGCNKLRTQSLSWLKTGNKRLKNPQFTAATKDDGTELVDKQGYRMVITMTMWDENGKVASDWLTHEACVLAMQTILYDCRGSNPDTRGGSFFYGSDGVAGYSLDPNCRSTPDKTCPKEGE